MTPEPALVIVVGATGDLARRKLLPALHSVLGPGGGLILGVASGDLDDGAFRDIVTGSLVEAGVKAGAAGTWAAEHVFYEQVGHEEDLAGLARRVEELDQAHGTGGRRVIYLAVPPGVVSDVVERLGSAGLHQSPSWVRLVLEKPFGRDAASAADLNAVVHASFSEEQVYRIDHYLGKETVRNLLVFRFTNPLFEASWSRDRIARVEITVAESVGIDLRGAFYDATGVVRDMLQSHLTQVLTLVAMESPATFQADDVRDEKVKVLRSISGIPGDALIRGQYAPGVVGGSEVAGYRDIEGVAADSNTATFAAARLLIDNWRWQGVPFYLRTGKAMERRLTEVAVVFRRPPICLFHSKIDGCIDSNDVLRLILQPDEGFSLEIDVKEPGDSTHLRQIPLRFSYSEAFGQIPDAYETLLADVLEGDQTLFVRSDEVEESWRLFSPLLDDDDGVHSYPAGTWGPGEAAALLPSDASGWATPGRAT